MFCLFVMALGAIVGLAHGVVLVAAILVLIGFVAIAILDPIAARRGQAPLFFARLRPPQMMIAIAGLVALIANLLVSA